MNTLFIEHLWKRTIVKDNCWLWTGNLGNDNYGRVQYKNKTVLVHRLSICIYHKIDYKSNFESCHICNNKNCWNPLHLYIGDHYNNMQDIVKSGNHHFAKRDCCINGHIFNKENTYIHDNRRRCRMCRMLNQRRYTMKKIKVSGSL